MGGCPGCGHANRDGARFCDHCGAPLGSLECEECGTELRPSARFCDACGARAGPRAGRSESGGDHTRSRDRLLSVDRESTGADPSLPESIGQGRYVITRFLGEGGRKRVFAARDHRLDRDVAVALIKTEGLDADGLTRVRREVEAMVRLGDHASIVTVYDAGEEDRRPYIVSEFMAGGALADVLARSSDHRLTPEEAVRVACAIASALAHAHDHGVVHRDLKPANVWLTDGNEVRLGDFGLAMVQDRSRLSLEGSMLGTVGYMSPEQVAGRNVGPPSDLYSLGCVLYETLTGRPPFTGEDSVAVISQHLNTQPVPPSWHRGEVSPALDGLVMELLAKNPEGRPPNANAVLERLQGLQPRARADDPSTERSTSVARLLAAPFVGREEELSRLKAGIEEALADRGSLMLVSGEPGIGKTRLLDEVSTYARMRNCRVLSGRCFDDEGAPAFWPWIQVIRSYALDHDSHSLEQELGSGAADIAQLVSEVREQLPGLPAPPTLEPEQARFRLFDAVTTFLRNASRNQPLLVVLDDIHAADAASLRLLQFLARDISMARVLVVGTYRDSSVEPGHPLDAVVSDLLRERPMAIIGLTGLTLGEVESLVASTAEQELDADSRELARLLHRETAGNPFFLEELLRHLVDSGLLYRRDGRWTGDVAGLQRLGSIEGVRELIGRRLAQLGDKTDDVLQTAAVVGREFGLHELAEITGSSIDELAGPAIEAVEAGVLQLESRSQHRYRFSHNLVREVLYEELSSDARRSLHQRTAEALERLHADDRDAHLPRLARHFVEGAHEPEKAVEYAVRAAERAREALAFEEAVDLYGDALRALDQLVADDHRRCELQLLLGDSEWRAGDDEAARAVFLEAAELAKKAGEGELLARAALGYGCGIGGFGFVESADEDLVGLLQHALDNLPSGDSALRVRLLARLATELYYTNEVERRAGLADEAVSMAERLGDTEMQLVALVSRHQALLGVGDRAERAAAVRRIVDLATQAGNREMLFLGRRSEFAVLLEGGEVHDARRVLEACHALARELRQPLYLWQTAVFDACIAYLDGDFDASERHSERALDIERTGSAIATIINGSQTLLMRWSRGGLESMEPLVEGLASNYRGLSAWAAALGFLRAGLGNTEGALEILQTLTAEGFQLRADGNWLISMGMLSFICAEVDAPDAARKVYAALEPHREDFPLALAGALSVGSCETMLGSAALQFDIDRAIGHLERGAEANRARGLLPWLAFTQGVLARAYARRNGPGDPEAALAAAAEAIDIGSRLGMSRAVDTALEAKLSVHGAPPQDLSVSLYAVTSAVATEGPDLRRHASGDGTVTIMFSDIENSTVLADRLGDSGWLQVLRTHNALIRDRLHEHDGHEVKAIGDGFMAVFSSARAAIRCASAIQASLRDHNRTAQVPLHVRIGLHTGEAIHEEEDFFGRNVIVASRIAAAAGGDEVLVSSVTFAVVAGSEEEFGFGEEYELELKGLAGAHRVRHVLWDTAHDDSQTAAGPASPAPASSSGQAPGVLAGNPPRQATPLVGREDEVRDLKEALALARVVTLTGLGGVGKTRLAMEVASTNFDSHPDGAWWCELAQVSDPDAVIGVIATALGVRPRDSGSLEAGIVAFLRDKRALVVLDGCEHLLEPVRAAVNTMVRSCPSVSVLVTSREPLHLTGEAVVPLAPLDVPTGHDLDALMSSGAITLFAERAADLDPGFALDHRTAPTIAEICRRLEGIPLAIELAAARLRAMSLSDVRDNLDERTRLLDAGRTSLDGRHQTLRGALDWSYELLEPPERRMLDRLSVFAGGFTLDAARWVSGGDGIDRFDVLDIISRLVEKSLLTAEAADGGTRYRMLETIREYARDRLDDQGELADYRSRHAHALADWAGQAASGIRGPDEVAWTEKIERELDNLREAVAWCIEARRPGPALAIGAELTMPENRLAYVAGPWARAAVDIPDAESDSRYPEALAAAAWVAHQVGDTEWGAQSAAAALDLIGEEPAGDTAAWCRTVKGASGLWLMSGEVAKAGEWAQRWEKAARSADDDYETAYALLMASAVQVMEGGDAGVPAEAAVEIARRLGNPSLLANSLLVLGHAVTWGNDPERAIPLLEEATHFADQVGNDAAACGTLIQVSRIHTTAGDYVQAMRRLLEAGRVAQRIGDHWSLSVSMGFFAVQLALLEDFEAAATLDGWSEHAQAARTLRFTDAEGEALDRVPGALGDRYRDVVTRSKAMDGKAVLAAASEALETHG